MACCSARRVSGRAWDGDSEPRFLLLELGILAAWVVLGGLGIVLITALAAVSPWARRQRGRFSVTVRDSLKRSGERVLDAPFLVGPAARCRVSSHLYRVHAPLAGFVFRWFNLLVLAGSVAAIAGLGVAGWTWLA